MGDLLGGSHDCDPQRLAVGLGWPTGGGDLRTALAGGVPGGGDLCTYILFK